MKDYTPEKFGELYADGYDSYWNETMERETADSVQFLSQLAPGGKALEFAIGTGRVALPLANAGLDVYGIEASEEMVSEMREKPGAAEISVVIGDMSEAKVDEKFDLIYLVFNTIFNLTTQVAQINCFKNAAHHLDSNGHFVIETVVPDFSEYVDGQRMKGSWAKLDSARFEIARQDKVNQTVAFQRVIISNDGVKMHPHFMRYAWPSELDLMAQLAGLELKERYGWWDRSPFTSESKSHVSVYGVK